MIDKLRNTKLSRITILLFATTALLPLVAQSNPVIRLILLLGVCTLPGFAALALFKFKFENLSSQLFYAVLLSLIILMSIFTTLSVSCHYFGISHPINEHLVIGVCDLVMEFSVAFLLFQLGKSQRSPFHEFSWSIFLPRLFCMLLPCVSLICVNRLNILSDSKSTTVFLIFLLLLLVLSGFDFVKTRDKNLQSWIIYGVSLSLIFGSTFRGTGGFWGYDINSEYFSASKVLTNGLWLPPHESSAYDSMLSITVLPVVLALFSKLSLTLIFKVFYSFVLALIPTVLYSVCTRIVSKFVSMLVVVGLIIGSISFIPQLPALAREVIGLAFFVGMITVVFERDWSLRRKTSLGLLMAGGMSVSHYSTSYIASILFGVNFLIYLFLLLIRNRRVRQERLVFSPAFSLAVILLTVLWNGVITHSLQDTKPIFQNIGVHGLQILPNSNQNLFSRWISGAIPSLSTTPKQMKINDYYANHKNHITPFSDSMNFVPSPTLEPKPKPILGALVASAYSKILVISRFFSQALAVIGVGYLIRKFFRRKTSHFKDLPALPNVSPLDVFPLGIGALILGLIARVSGTLAGFYNPERTAIQIEVAVLIATAIALERILYRHGVASLVIATPTAIFFIALIVSATSLDGYVAGSDVSRISNLNLNTQPFAISASEIEGAKWLDSSLGSNAVIQTDSRGFLALLQVGRKAIASIDPYSLAKDSYIYASNMNVNGKLVLSSFIYKFPTQFINSHFQTIYSSSQVMIYH